MWKELVRRLEPELTFRPAVSATRMAAAESESGIVLPEELKAFLSETDGLDGPRGQIIWSLDHILSENRAFRANAEFRSLYMAFDQLVFFAEEGNGDLFAYRVLPEAVLDTEIYLWYHENDSRAWFAPGLERFLEWARRRHGPRIAASETILVQFTSEALGPDSPEFQERLRQDEERKRRRRRPPKPDENPPPAT